MNRKDLIDKLKQHFDIRELVCPHTYARFGDMSWMFLSDKLLQLLYILRFEILKTPMIINDYVNKGTFTQRGFRCNICNITKSNTERGRIYLSAHTTGNGIDVVFRNITAAMARDIITQNIDKIPFPIRMERDVSWLHIDVYDNGNGDKITLF